MNSHSPIGTPPAFDLPAALLSQGYRLRPETDADIPFLMTLYACLREEELEPVPWSDEVKAAFCAQQFAAQRSYYYEAIPNVRFDVLEHKGEPIGRLYLQDRPTRLHIIDIALMPAVRGQGLGTRLLLALHDVGRASGRGVGIMVEKFNPALNLYRRLGYLEVADHGVHLEMEWMPDSAS
ncbi:MAG: GNAT family N-acetyltransferase [Rhizomicrobium sp.]|nr:GNAT family N-acetyltransferase [Rhizomicrobium sp.]